MERPMPRALPWGWCLAFTVLLAACGGNEEHVRILDRHGRVRAEMTLVDGVREGRTTCFDAQGRVTGIMSFRNDLRHGDQFQLDAHGDTLSILHFENGRKHGTQLYRSAAGKLLRVERFDHGDPDGPMFLFHADGSPREMDVYADGATDGPHREWSPGDTTGHYFLDGHMRKGACVSTWKWYFKNGRISRVGAFDANAPHGRWRRWDDRGRLIEDLEFDHGTLVRTLLERRHPR